MRIYCFLIAFLVLSSCNSIVSSSHMSNNTLLLNEQDKATIATNIQARYNEEKIDNISPDVYISCADINFDTYPEIIYGVSKYMHENIIHYWVYSLVDHQILRDKNTENELIVISGRDFFGSKYYIDEKEQKYFLSIMHTGTAIMPYIMTYKIWYRDGLYITSEEVEEKNFSILDSSHNNPYAFGRVNMNNIPQSIEACLLLYSE